MLKAGMAQVILIETLMFMSMAGVHTFSDGITVVGTMVPWQNFIYYSHSPSKIFLPGRFARAIGSRLQGETHHNLIELLYNKDEEGRSLVTIRAPRRASIRA